MTVLTVRRLTVADVADFRAIRLAALQGAPEAFGSTYEVEATRPLAAFEEGLAASIVLGAYVDGRIAGMVGLHPDTGRKTRHKATLWGMYVRPEARSLGVGAALVAELIEAAEDVVEQITLMVVQDNATAIALYRRFGFEPYGLEPRALKTEAGYADEVMMVRFLRPQDAASGGDGKRS
jgi:ribosomal protein S18 acetylase RimI-like enzyme